MSRPTGTWGSTWTTSWSGLTTQRLCTRRADFLRRHRSFNVCNHMLLMFDESVCYGEHHLLCCAVLVDRNQSKGRQQTDKLIRKACSLVGSPLASLEEGVEQRMPTKLLAIMDITSHPLHETVNILRSSFSNRMSQLSLFDDQTVLCKLASALFQS